MTEKILADKNLVVRHSVLELIEHWAMAISGIILLLTGIFELPVAKRYYIIVIPGLRWTADFITSLYLHYAAAAVFMAAGAFHLFYHGLRGEKGMIPRRGDFADIHYRHEEFHRHRKGTAHAQISAGTAAGVCGHGFYHADADCCRGWSKPTKTFTRRICRWPLFCGPPGFITFFSSCSFWLFWGTWPRLPCVPTGRWCAASSPVRCAWITPGIGIPCGWPISNKHKLPGQYPKRLCRWLRRK